jgi:hypothetical protein
VEFVREMLCDRQQVLFVGTASVEDDDGWCGAVGRFGWLDVNVVQR